jgi:Zn-dependent protease with chaperone function
MKWLIAILLLSSNLAADPAESAWSRLQQTLREKQLQLQLPDERLERIGARLTSLQKRYPVQWHFALVDSDKADAGCTGEGAIYVTSGLLRLELDDDELAGILGHEIAHGILRHVEANQLALAEAEEVRQEQRAARQQVAELEAARGQLAPAEYTQRRDALLTRARNLKSRIDSLRVQAITAPETLRAQESQADSVGLQLARRAGFRADGLLRALKRLQDQPSAREELGGFSHPPLAQRIADLEILLQGLPQE